VATEDATNSLKPAERASGDCTSRFKSIGVYHATTKHSFKAVMVHMKPNG
jgi:hypothetical protein